MSTCYITEPKAIPLQKIKGVIEQAANMEIVKNSDGGYTILAVKNPRAKRKETNWLHLEIDEETQTMESCYRNGGSDASTILAHLMINLECRFISEHEPEYYGVADWSDLEWEEDPEWEEELEGDSPGELSVGN